MARRWGSGTRILAAYLALALVTALVVVVGAAEQPVYGGAAPFGGTRFDELRAAPKASGWTLDLASAVAPGIPVECVVLRAGDVDAAHELVTATVPSSSPTGRFTACTRYASAVAARLVMVDPATGRVLWTRDLAGDLGLTSASVVWHASSTRGVVVVGVDALEGDDLVGLDVSTGRTRGRTSVPDPDDVINFAVVGDLVLTASPDADSAVTRYSLRRVDDVSDLVWTEETSSSVFPQLLSHRLLVPLPTGTVSVDGSTGRVTAWPHDLSRDTGVQVAGDRVFAVLPGAGVGLAPTLEAYRADGTVDWRYTAAGIAAVATSRDCVVVSRLGSTTTCLDPTTGRARWSADLPGVVEGTPPGATTSDIEIVAPVRTGDTTLRVSEVDAASGRVRFASVLPRGMVVAGQSRTVGYAIDAPDQASGSGRLSAFDLSSGRVLWTVSSVAPPVAAPHDTDYFDVWGGHLVALTGRGTVSELTTTTADGPRHGMLDR
ncbi:outer membrane protein assembly factor BamB family protein [Frondihabitans cladoniiphilus]|uniref:Pyrrolo-quinoline quinone repeat domain-containing protein n=1 Tax=Frondihabitans cladoniiphilus TaxID=715785 RepID=A0ABP8VLX0_9MICO